ncbi:MAG: caspase family protein [Cyanobacteria bacterium J06560_6]
MGSLGEFTAGDNPAHQSSQKGESKAGLSRRAFIQRAGLFACALGLAELTTDLPFDSTLAKDYAQALAAEMGARKLALLIGIDNYPENTLPDERPDERRLAGSKTDVALQKELLIHRFGFAPADIVCLTDKQATREGIYEAFVSHLLAQAAANDVVVFHFSGYGSRVQLPDLSGQTTTLRSLVPYDGRLPTDSRPAVNDILEIELKALLKQLKTKNVTSVIDAGFVDIPLPLSGGLRSRARPQPITGQQPAPFDLLSTQKPATESEEFPGILLRGASVNDVVLERQWNDFNAGAFTYVLTQYLWTAPAPVVTKLSLARAQETLFRWGGSNQQPVSSGKSDRTKDSPIYSTPLMDGTRGEGVITALSGDGKTATLWLGGLPPRVLEYLDSPAVMSCGGRRLEVRSHNGLTGKAKLVEDKGNDGAPLKVGQPLFESVRALPKNPNLVVALDSRLERIERVDATSALSALSFVSSTSDTGMPADCLLARPADVVSGTLNASLRPIRLAQSSRAASEGAGSETSPETLGNAGYGLFSLTRSLIPGTLALQEEAIKPAISRLSSKLRSLMALKLLRLTENRATSTLPIRVKLEQIGTKENKLLIARQTFKRNQLGKREIEGFTPEVPIGNRVRYKLFNDGDKPLYYTLINVDPRERLSAFCPAAVDDTAIVSETNNPDASMSAISAASIAPGKSVAIPGAGMDWAVEMPAGPVETYVVCTTRPLDNTFNLLLSEINNGGERVNPLPNPLDVVRSILSDMSRGDSNDSYMLDVSEWATLNFTYQAV